MRYSVQPARGSCGGGPAMTNRLWAVAVAVLIAVAGISACGPTGGTPPPSDHLSAGASLASGQLLQSPSGKYTAVMQADGNFVVYQGRTALWSTGTSSPGSTLAMQADGNLVVYSAAHVAQWSSATNGQNNLSLWIQDDGNLVIYTADHRPVWSTMGGYTGERSDSIDTGQALASGGYLISPSGKYTAVMQADGNFVVYQG